MRPLIVVLLAALAVLAAQPAAAQVYRHVDANGVVTYTDKPPSKDAKPVQLPEILTYKPEQSPDEVISTVASKPAAKTPSKGSAMPDAPYAVDIASPTPDETFRDPVDELTVAVNVMPGLSSGLGLIYYLDGTAFNPKPLMQTSLTINGAFRGTHTVQVALVDSAGKELARSPEVTVHMRPPIARPAESPNKK